MYLKAFGDLQKNHSKTLSIVSCRLKPRLWKSIFETHKCSISIIAYFSNKPDKFAQNISVFTSSVINDYFLVNVEKQQAEYSKTSKIKAGHTLSISLDSILKRTLNTLG